MKLTTDKLTLKNILEISDFCKDKCKGTSTVEEVSQVLMKTLYDIFVDASGEKEFVLCRMFKSCFYMELPEGIKKYIQNNEGANEVLSQKQYLTLIGTYGVKKEWQARTTSRAHQAISLYDPRIIQEAPMMSALFKQIGFEMALSPKPDSSILISKQDKDFGVFVVEDAVGSKLIPHQMEFVEPFGITSAFGFGGMFSNSNIFAVIVFSKKRISIEKAKTFFCLAPSFKFIQIEHQMRGSIFKVENKTLSEKALQKLELDIQSEKTKTLFDELNRAHYAFNELSNYLQKANKDLGNEVAERKKAEEESTKAKEEAERANRAKSEFLARMSHELRTPLNSIIGFSQILMRNKMEKLTFNQTDDVGNIYKAGKHLLQLINEVLDLSFIESGKIDVAREPVNVLNVLAEVLDLTRIWAEQNGIEIINKITRQDIFVLADQVRLKQVLLNLVSNAIKFNKEGGSITIFCEETPNILISIADTGLGIPEDQHASLFEPFSRLRPEATQIAGVGIGLSISKKLVELMHGKISFTSAPDEGTCFTIELPSCDPPMSKDQEVVSSVQTTVERKIIPDIIFTILYIEDNPLNLSLVEKFLRDRNDIKLFTAPQAKLGLELARAHRPDLILMDINLPGMSGIEAYEYLQTSKETKHIPVVAISADAMEVDIERTKKAGFNE